VATALVTVYLTVELPDWCTKEMVDLTGGPNPEMHHMVEYVTCKECHQKTLPKEWLALLKRDVEYIIKKCDEAAEERNGRVTYRSYLVGSAHEPA
jgi:hypothetical protein